MNSLLLTEQSTSPSTEKFRGDLNKIQARAVTSCSASCASNFSLGRNSCKSDKDLLFKDVRGLDFCFISVEISLRESKRITWRLRNLSSKLLLLMAFNRIGKSKWSPLWAMIKDKVYLSVVRENDKIHSVPASVIVLIIVPHSSLKLSCHFCTAH